MARETRRFLAAIACIAVAGLGVSVVEQSAAAPALLRRSVIAPAAGVWTLDRAASRLTFRGSVGGQTVDGVFKRWDAQIAFDPRNLRNSHAAVTIDVSSLLTGDPVRDQILPGPDWFNVARFPAATFVANTITQTGPNHYQAEGELRIRGVVQQAALPFTLILNRDRATLRGAITLDRLAFGVGQGRLAEATPVSRRVVVQVRLSARAQR